MGICLSSRKKNTSKSRAEINTIKLPRQHIINSSYKREGTILEQRSLDPFSDGPFRDDSVHTYPWVFFLTIAGIRRERIKKKH